MKILFILFLLFEIFFSFKRYKYIPLDGDFPAIVLPNKSYQKVLSDPFGFNVLIHDFVYPATNRFFAHWSLSLYFRNAPLLFQTISSPINSIYLSCALAKTFIQFFIIYLLAAYITGKYKFWDFDFLLAATLVAPLFQIYGYNMWMGIIDYSITYTFFYAFALLLVLLFFLPFFNSFFHGKNYRFNIFTAILLVALSVVISLHGPPNAPVVVLICSSVLLYLFIMNFQRTSNLQFFNRIKSAMINTPNFLILICLFCLYSLYIGKNNSENFWETIPLSERYAKLPQGFSDQFFNKLGPSVMMIMILINSVIIKKYGTDSISRKYLIFLKWTIILSVLYILLLPVGGYRSYRPLIIRMDTIMPVTLALMLLYGLSTFQIIKNINIRFKKFYFVLVGAVMAIFINADTAVRKNNRCEKNAFEKIASSPDEIVFLDNDCSVMSWGKTFDYRDTEIKTELLRHWGVTDRKKYFYQK